MDDLVAWLTQIWDEQQGILTRLGEILPTPINRERLARITADRQILTLHTGPHECPFWDGNGEYWEDLYCPTALLLARAHADRPGFQDEWRVTS